MEHWADGRLTLEPGTIARITLAAPDRRNAISAAMWGALPLICARLAGAAETRVVILAAQGAVFSAGADIAEFETVYATADSTAAYNAAVRAGQAAVAALPMPVIAAVAGPCVGGGCGLALHADMIFAGPAARFGITPARLGLAYSWEDTARLVARVGPARAKDMLFSARLLAAEDAHAWGLIDRLGPDPLAEAQSFAEGLASLSPMAQRAAKATIDGLAYAAPGAEAAARALFAAAFAGPDFAEGRAAFLARRPPQF